MGEDGGGSTYSMLKKNSEKKPRKKGNAARKGPPSAGKEEGRSTMTKIGTVMRETSTEDKSSRRKKSIISKSKEENSANCDDKTSKQGSKRKRKKGVKLDPASEKAVCAFVKHVDTMGVDGLKKEFEENKTYIPSDARHDVFDCNKERNRFPDVMCWDATRVVLQDGVPPLTDYIHANKIVLDGVERTYIATQGPKENTIEDFWRMISQETPSYVVMLCNIEENGMQKCAQYWPKEQGSYKTYGKMFVNNKKMETENKLDVYHIEVLPEGCSNSHVTKLIHVTNWPDQGVPTSGRMVLRLIKMIGQENTGNPSGTIVVHCSAGVGRTGTVVAIDAICTRLFHGKETTVKEVFCEIRRQRAHSIQTEPQYLFIFTTVLDYIKAKTGSKHNDAVGKFYKELAEKCRTE